MSSNCYRIRSLDDLVRIPPSTIPRLIAEMPSIIEAIRDQYVLGVTFDFIDWYDDGNTGLNKVYVNGE